jgi:hypothetical protein
MVEPITRARMGTTLMTNKEHALHLVASSQETHHARHDSFSHGGPRENMKLGLTIEE